MCDDDRRLRPQDTNRSPSKPLVMENAGLSPRLYAVAGGVPGCGTLADVGTETAALPAYLLSAGRCRRAIAVDRSPQAISSARRRLQQLDVTERCDLRLGDGLSPLRPGEADAIVISGVGARSIIHMLDADLARLVGQRAVPVLVLQPMSEPHLLRHWILRRGRSLGVTLLRESLAEDAGRYYHVMIAGDPVDSPVAAVPDDRLEAAARAADPLAAADLGLQLLAGPDPLLVPYLRWRRESLGNLISRAQESGSVRGNRKAEAARLLADAFARTEKALHRLSSGSFEG